MIASKILATATVALSALAAIGCSSPTTNEYASATPAPTIVAATPPPEPVMTAEAMPAPPASTVIVSDDTPVVVATNTEPAIITERAPRADRN